MKAHKYWSLGALATMIGTFYTGYKNMKSAHKYFACSSLLCMIMAIYSGHKMISGKSRKRKDPVSEEARQYELLIRVVKMVFQYSHQPSLYRHQF